MADVVIDSIEEAEIAAAATAAATDAAKLKESLTQVLSGMPAVKKVIENKASALVTMLAEGGKYRMGYKQKDLNPLDVAAHEELKRQQAEDWEREEKIDPRCSCAAFGYLSFDSSAHALNCVQHSDNVRDPHRDGVLAATEENLISYVEEFLEELGVPVGGMKHATLIARVHGAFENLRVEL